MNRYWKNVLMLEKCINAGRTIEARRTIEAGRMYKNWKN